MAEGLGQGGTLEKREGLKGVREREIQSRTFRFRPDPDVDFYCGPPLGPTPPPTPPLVVQTIATRRTEVRKSIWEHLLAIY